MTPYRFLGVAAAAALLPACSLSGLLGGGGKAPTTLQTLTTEAADPGPIQRTVNAGQAVTVGTPTISKELRTTRVPVQLGPTDIQYVTGLEWVDTPDKLFQGLLEETIRRTTGRVVLDSPAIIGWTISSTWFQRRVGLTSVIATMAGGQQSVTVLDVPEATGTALARDAVPGLVEQFLEPSTSGRETSV